MNYEIKKYKDGQVTAKLTAEGDLLVKLRGNTYEELFAAASVKEAWDAVHSLKKNAVAVLELYSLIGQRSDRRFHTHESFDLKVIAKFINSLNFDKVALFHPHSAISLALIENSVSISHLQYVQKACAAIGNPVLISPDAGAYKTTHEIAEQLHTDLIPSNKVRINGVPFIDIQGDVNGKKCLIVDDMADGGRTFKLLADELKAQGASKVYLYVSHAQFNYGFEELKQAIDHIYCTNSYKDIADEYVTQYKVV